MSYEFRPLKETALLLGGMAGCMYLLWKGMHCAISNDDFDTYDSNLYDGHKRFVYGVMWPVSAGIRMLTSSNKKSI